MPHIVSRSPWCSAELAPLARPSPACSPGGRARSPSASAGTSSVIDDPAATYAPLPIVHRRDELRVAADEHVVLDDGRMLVHAVVVARDRAGADVDVRRRSSRRRDTPDGWPSSRARASSSSARRSCRRARPRRRSTAGRMCANGPISAPCSTVESTMIERSSIVTSSPTVAFVSRTPAWMRQRCADASCGLRAARRADHRVRRRSSRPRRCSVVAGSSSVTPSSISARFLRARSTRPRSARSTRLFTPRSSSGASRQQRLDPLIARAGRSTTRSVR